MKKHLVLLCLSFTFLNLKSSDAQKMAKILQDYAKKSEIDAKLDARVKKTERDMDRGLNNFMTKVNRLEDGHNTQLQNLSARTFEIETRYKALADSSNVALQDLYARIFSVETKSKEFEAQNARLQADNVALAAKVIKLQAGYAALKANNVAAAGASDAERLENYEKLWSAESAENNVINEMLSSEFAKKFAALESLVASVKKPTAEEVSRLVIAEIPRLEALVQKRVVEKMHQSEMLKWAQKAAGDLVGVDRFNMAALTAQHTDLARKVAELDSKFNQLSLDGIDLPGSLSSTPGPKSRSSTPPPSRSSSGFDSFLFPQ